MAWAAGVLPVSVRPDGEPVALLGLDAWSKGGKWSDFAGGAEPGDASPEDTALRELREETGGKCVRLCAADLGNAMCVRDETPSGKVIVRFVARVPWDPDAPRRFVPNAEKTAAAWFELRRLPRLRYVFYCQMERDMPRLVRWILHGKQDGSNV